MSIFVPVLVVKNKLLHNMSVTTKIAKHKLTNPVANTRTTFEELWKDQSCVIVFLRRWG